jgi:hypothetical protein
MYVILFTIYVFVKKTLFKSIWPAAPPRADEKQRRGGECV